MEPYGNLDGHSGVLAYDEGDDWIVVEFVRRPGGVERFYRYTAASAGTHVVREMQQLARRGRGLASFISRHNPTYADTWH